MTVALLLIFAAIVTNLVFTVLNRPAIAFSSAGDEDVKIAFGPDSPAFVSSSASRGDSGEAEAKVYLKQRSLGNTHKAGELGEKLAESIILSDSITSAPRIDDDDFIVQLKVLRAFAVSRALDEHSPNKIITQTALSSFYDLLQDRAPEFYNAITELGSFSLYIYLYRSSTTEPIAFATAFSEVCGNKFGDECFDTGLTAYTDAYDMATSLIRKADFILE